MKLIVEAVIYIYIYTNDNFFKPYYIFITYGWWWCLKHWNMFQKLNRVFVFLKIISRAQKQQNALNKTVANYSALAGFWMLFSWRQALKITGLPFVAFLCFGYLYHLTIRNCFRRKFTNLATIFALSNAAVTKLLFCDVNGPIIFLLLYDWRQSPNNYYVNRPNRNVFQIWSGLTG